jgi:hypothetical protein
LQAIPGRPDILVLHALQHFLRNHLQLRLRARAERDDRLGIAHIDLGHTFANAFGNRGRGCLQRHDLMAGLGKNRGGDLFNFGNTGGGVGHKKTPWTTLQCAFGPQLALSAW